jgi:hypothetical protein
MYFPKKIPRVCEKMTKVFKKEKKKQEKKS